ncbi:hypothetical protein H6F77_09325 [Microcoleus sp. FACHB-831]|nr:hypothetical protein [Microcoleus sp. FACHB-831]MBD1921291.1 hypothetical protein [Microcoleus sp. FACHB-831]
MSPSVYIPSNLHDDLMANVARISASNRAIYASLITSGHQVSAAIAND